MTTKKPVATLAKKEEVKETVKAPVAEVKKEEVKTSDVTAAKATETKVKETAKKAPAKKTATTKTKATTAKAETVKKKSADTKETVKKATAAKASRKNVMVAVQFADKNYTMDDLEKIANDVWVYDYNKKASELKDIQLYVKPEEAKVYYVFNNEIAGDFNI